MLKSHILFDNTKTSKKIKNFLDHKIKNTSLGKCNLIIVVGGDGFMLSALKKYSDKKTDKTMKIETIRIDKNLNLIFLIIFFIKNK